MVVSMWLLAEKGKNHVLRRLKSAQYLKNLSHQGCENALKVLAKYYSWGPSTILVLKKVLKMFKGQQFVH